MQVMNEVCEVHGPFEITLDGVRISGDELLKKLQSNEQLRGAIFTIKWRTTVDVVKVSQQEMTT
jgi:hypothetical protein